MASTKTATPQSTRALLAQALRQQQSGLWRQAERLYRCVLAAEPGNPQALHRLGSIALRAGRFDEAVTLIRQSLAIAPCEAIVHNSLGDALRGLGRLPEAAVCYAHAVALKPDYTEARDNLRAAGHERAPAPRRRVLRHIPAGSRVLDIGAGLKCLREDLPSDCHYLAAELPVPVADLNQWRLPAGDHDCVVMLDVLPRLGDPRSFLERAQPRPARLILNYPLRGSEDIEQRRARGWLTDYAREELEALLEDLGWQLLLTESADGDHFFICRGVRGKPAGRRREDLQTIAVNTAEALRILSPAPSPAPGTHRVLLLAGGDFGDRLGHHLIHELLPATAAVIHADVRTWNVPDEQFDLLVLGTGGTLQAPLLTDNLLRLLERVPRTIGIFGTGHRDRIQRGRLDAVIDRLTLWLARHEDDRAMFGQGHHNVVHFGDWLINAFPLGRGTRPGTAIIGGESWQSLPLDQLIRAVHAHRRVFSTCANLLLCALTSAEQVAYRGQPDAGAGTASDTFRSMLADVFGQTYPEGQFFDVDHDAVIRYKQRARTMLDGMREAMNDILNDRPATLPDSR